MAPTSIGDGCSSSVEEGSSPDLDTFLDELLGVISSSQLIEGKRASGNNLVGIPEEVVSLRHRIDNRRIDSEDIRKQERRDRVIRPESDNPPTATGFLRGIPTHIQLDHNWTNNKPNATSRSQILRYLSQAANMTSLVYDDRNPTLSSALNFSSWVPCLTTESRTAHRTAPGTTKALTLETTLAKRHYKVHGSKTLFKEALPESTLSVKISLVRERLGSANQNAAFVH